MQQLIIGEPLYTYLNCRLGSQGIPNANIFFGWAKKLIECLIEIHQRQIVHGDIWPPNILIQENGNPVFIDFGQALFRDLVISGVGVGSGSHVFIPPEGSGSVSSDIYSFGGVLYYLATGQYPPTLIKEMKDIDDLKTEIAESIKVINRPLYEQNCGIVDIIVRCLRHSQHNRHPHAEGVLQDIETFSITQLTQVRQLARKNVEYRA